MTEEDQDLTPSRVSDDGRVKSSGEAERDLRIGAWPIAIIEDRYGGTYSGGHWLAIAEADCHHAERPRVSAMLDEGPHGDDCEAMEFWMSPPPWIAVGMTPDAALAALLKALSHPAKQVHTFAPTEFGGDVCSICDGDIRSDGHYRADDLQRQAAGISALRAEASEPPPRDPPAASDKSREGQ